MLPFPSLLFFLPIPGFAEKGRTGSISPYLQDVNVCIAEVDVEDFGEEGHQRPSTAVGKKSDQVQSAWPRGINLPGASSIVSFMPPGLCPCPSYCREHTASTLPAG